MRDETKERWRELCARVLVEPDPQKFEAAIQELLQDLDDHEKYLRDSTRENAAKCEFANIECLVRDLTI